MFHEYFWSKTAVDGPELSLGGVSARMAGTVRGEGTYAAGPQNGIASLAVSCSV